MLAGSPDLQMQQPMQQPVQPLPGQASIALLLLRQRKCFRPGCLGASHVQLLRHSVLYVLP